jgi:pyruvyltransferase
MRGDNLTRAFWMTSANVGDNLNHYLLSRLSSPPLVFTGIEVPVSKIVAIGSILNWCNEHCIAWGPGLASEADCVNPAAKVAAVRGPRSWKRAKECGLNAPEVFGDPALLMPRIYKPKPHGDCKPAIIAHYVDQYAVFSAYIGDKNIDLIDVLDEPEKVVDRIASASCVMSSSLHGIILAHAYGIPAAWVDFGGPIGGDGLKYRDHFEAVGLKVDAAADLKDLPALDLMLKRCAAQFRLHPRIDTKDLLKAAPFPVVSL